MRITYEKPALGVGGFGKVYKAHVVGQWEGSRAIALKKIRASDYVEYPALLHEACGLVLAKDHPSIPQLFGWGRSQFYEYLAMELLGCDLTTRFKCESLTRGNFVSLVLQMFAAVKHVHANGILHCDIKPDNFVFGAGENAGRIYLIDFNLWTAWRDFDTHEHLDKDAAAEGFRGTFRYASINCHLDRALSRRDDLESLAYAIFDLYAGRLPWSHLSEEGPEAILESKQIWQKSQSLQGSCEYPLGDLVDYAQNLEYSAEPEYDRWREEFWRVDNKTSGFPESDPLYDPADTTEEVPGNMNFVNWAGPRGNSYDLDFPVQTNTGRMVLAPGSDHDYRPASSKWGKPLTMLPEDTISGVRDIIQGVVQHISQPPTTTYPSLSSSCPTEQMRGFDDPIPFKIYIKVSQKSQEEVEGAARERLGGEELEETEIEGEDMKEETGNRHSEVAGERKGEQSGKA